MTAPLVCGIDAGGTKTECLLTTAGGAVLARVAGGAGRLGADGSATRTVAALASRACAEAGVKPARIGVLVAGMSGVDAVAAQQRAVDELTELLPGVPVAVRNDGEVALVAATDERPAAVLVAGTGSIAYGETADGCGARVGGWGHLLGDEGSGFDLGARAVRGILRALDGRITPTRLTPRAIAHFGVAAAADLVELTEQAAAEPQLLASFAPVVCATAREGDALARAVLAEASAQLAATATTLMRRIGAPQGCPLALAGGVLVHERPYASTVAARIASAAPRTRFVRDALPSVAGAVLAAIAQLHDADCARAARPVLADALTAATPAPIVRAGA